MKKTISVLLVCLFAVSTILCMPAHAATNEVITLHLKSDLDGVKPDEYEKFADVNCDIVVFDTREGKEPVYASDFAGSMYTDALKAGRTYSVYYVFIPANGYELPEKLDENNLKIECDKGVTVYDCAITSDPSREQPEEQHAVRIFAQVKVDGNIFQRIFGRLYDIYLKIRAWSLY